MKPERTIKKWLVPGSVIEEFSTRHGYSWQLAEIRGVSIEVFWDKDTLYVRQESPETLVDMIELNTGQAYDLIHALSRALEVGEQR